MATGWIPVGVSTPRCTEVVRIASKAGKTRRETLAALIEFWVWVTQESSDGFLADYTLSALTSVVEDTDDAFWMAVADEGWIEISPKGLQIPENKEHQYITRGARSRLMKAKRQGKWKEKKAHKETLEETHQETEPETKKHQKTSPPARPTETETEDQKTDIRSDTGKSLLPPPAGGGSDLGKISPEELEHAAPLADALFKRSGYTKEDGGLLWQLAVLVKRGAVVESWVHSACEGARLNSDRNPVGFVRVTLTEVAQKNGRDLPAMLRQAKLPKGSYRGPPRLVVNGVAAELANTLARKDSP